MKEITKEYQSTFTERDFTSPGVAYRGRPLWCWNGKLEVEELLRQLRIFKEMGLGGFFMHSRTGLQTEYLGEEWFECIRTCAEEAKKQGLEAWLYDEDRWPSGSAGGKATEDPALRMQYLRLTLYPSLEDLEIDPEAIVAVFKGVVDGVDFYSSSRVTDWTVAEPGEGSYMVFSREVMNPHPFFNGNAYLDTLNRDATEQFIEATHSAYEARCGALLGKAISGIFTDEPHHGMVLCENVQHNYQENSGWVLPWTGQLSAVYEKAFGQDLLSYLPELFLRKKGEHLSVIKWRYMEVLQRMFLENWAAPIREASNGMQLLLTGHVLHEDTLSAQVIPCGSLMRYYEHLDYPGIDVLGSKNENFWLAKPVQSASRQQGKPWIMSELYGCTGWEMGFDGHKRIGDWQAMLGVNLRSHHLCWYSMAGESKRDYPASLFFQSPWYKDYAVVEDYFSRLGYLLQRGQPMCEVLVINPVESVAAQIYPGWATWMGSNSAAVDRLERQYEGLFRLLTNAQIDFDYGDEDQMSRWARVVEEAGVLWLELGHARYRHVIVSGMETMRSTTLEVLREFKSRGGSVYFLGEAPDCLDAASSDGPKAFAAQCERYADLDDGFVQTLGAAIGAPVCVRLLSWADHQKTPLLSQIRRCEGEWIVVLLNTLSEGEALELEVSFEDPDLQVEELDCRSGQRFATHTAVESGKRILRVKLNALCELALIATRTESKDLKVNPLREFQADQMPLCIRDGFAYQLDEPNICVLDQARFKLGEQAWSEPTEIIRLDAQIRKQLGIAQRDGEMLQPWAARKNNNKAEPTGIPLVLEFAFQVEPAVPFDSVDLLLEQPECFDVEVNGEPISLQESSGWFIDPCFHRFSIPKNRIQTGPNTIRLRTAFSHEVDLEAIYLLGEFGVKLGGETPSLTALPTRLTYGSITDQGLPFYSGKIFYQVQLPPDTPSDTFLVDMDACFEGAFAKLHRSGSDDVAFLGMPPYRAIMACGGETELQLEVCLTRRNTFGPFHELSNPHGFTAPSSFRSENDNFTEAHQLVPTGLITSPRFYPLEPEKEQS